MVDVAKFDQLGSNDRVKGKIEKIKQFAREAVKGTSRQQVSSDEVLTLRETIQTMRRDIEVNKLWLIKGAIARKRQVFEKMAQKSKTAFHWLKIRHWNALAHCAHSYSRADA